MLESTYTAMRTRFPCRERKAMRPGQIFVTDVTWHILEIREPLVVINERYEVGFWTGATYCYGDVMPGVLFEVLS